jgi:pentatricopeptide repeat protein
MQVGLYSHMRQSGVAPNELCYNLLIRACSVGGRLDEMTDIMRKLVSAPPHSTPPSLHTRPSRVHTCSYG